jgi:hypothetical protein
MIHALLMSYDFGFDLDCRKLNARCMILRIRLLHPPLLVSSMPTRRNANSVRYSCELLSGPRTELLRLLVTIE